MNKIVVFTTLAIFHFSCATIAKKDLTQTVNFAPKQDSCHVLVDGKYIGKSPLVYNLDITKEHSITYAKLSYLPRTFTIESKRNNKWVVKDIFAGIFIFSPLTLSKDKKTKAWNELDTNKMPAELVHWEQALPPSDYLNTLFQIEDLYFETASYKIASKHHKNIDKLISIFNKYPDIKVVIHGHSDKKGNEENNNSLSVKRAEAVKKHLISKGIKAERIITVGHGSSQPIYDATDQSLYYQNRR